MLARVLLVVVPAQLVGAFVSFLIIPLRALADHPALGWCTYLLVALVAGTALGLVLRPPRQSLVTHAVASSVVGALVLTIFLVVGGARGGGGACVRTRT